MNVTLYVGNLSKLTTEAALTNLFSQVGDVTSLRIMKDQDSGESRAYGFLTMSSENEADKAVSKFNGYSFEQHNLKVGLTKPRTVRGPGGPVL
jgi:RNA recognition motif-containing protein